MSQQILVTEMEDTTYRSYLSSKSKVWLSSTYSFTQNGICDIGQYRWNTNQKALNKQNNETVHWNKDSKGNAYDNGWSLRAQALEGRCKTFWVWNRQGRLPCEYEGGYQSWSPAEPFEKAYKLSETFLDRLRIEYAEVKERFISLDNFYKKGFDGVAEIVGARQAALLLYQMSSMRTYVEVLETRIEDIEQSMKNDK